MRVCCGFVGLLVCVFVFVLVLIRSFVSAILCLVVDSMFGLLLLRCCFSMCFVVVPCCSLIRLLFFCRFLCLGVRVCLGVNILVRSGVSLFGCAILCFFIIVVFLSRCFVVVPFGSLLRVVGCCSFIRLFVCPFVHSFVCLCLFGGV